MNTFEHIALKIIREQELLMGPVAWQQAGKVDGLQILDRSQGILYIDKKIDGKSVVNNLVERYGMLFGRAGREVCKEAVGALVADLEPSQIPSSLK